jgi:hypothetical protein
MSAHRLRGSDDRLMTDGIGDEIANLGRSWIEIFALDFEENFVPL